jgi:hypothetical protein
MIPLGLTARTLSLKASAMTIFPSPPTATPVGSASAAEIAGPPSPLKPGVGVPATVQIVFPATG